MKRRIFAMLLSLAMLFTLAPTAFAVETIETSGNCGATQEDNVTWALMQNNEDSENPTYTLTISGTGAMYDYPTGDGDNWWTDWNLPWKYCYDMIQRVVVEEGVTYLGEESLSSLRNATSLSLPNSLTTIGQAALYAIGVSSLVIPDKVVSIGDFAFNGCANLQTITLPAGLRKIGHCFIECSNLKTINFKGTMKQWLACGGGESTFPAQTQVVCASGTLNLDGTCGDDLT